MRWANDSSLKNSLESTPPRFQEIQVPGRYAVCITTCWPHLDTAGRESSRTFDSICTLSKPSGLHLPYFLRRHLFFTTFLIPDGIAPRDFDPPIAPFLRGRGILRSMCHLHASLPQYRAFVEQGIDNHIVIRDTEVEDPATIMPPLVLRGLEDPMDRSLEVVARPPQHNLAGVDDDTAGGVLNVSPLGVVVVIPDLQARHWLAEEE